MIQQSGKAWEQALISLETEKTLEGSLRSHDEGKSLGWKVEGDMNLEQGSSPPHTHTGGDAECTCSQGGWASWESLPLGNTCWAGGDRSPWLSTLGQVWEPERDLGAPEALQAGPWDIQNQSSMLKYLPASQVPSSALNRVLTNQKTQAPGLTRKPIKPGHGSNQRMGVSPA